MQKLLTIYLNNQASSDKKQAEHLKKELAAGWKIVSITPVGAAVGSSIAKGNSSSNVKDIQIDGYIAGWIAVVLEK